MTVIDASIERYGNRHGPELVRSRDGFSEKADDAVGAIHLVGVARDAFLRGLGLCEVISGVRTGCADA